eukprot:scaffold84865_cov19-Tisochrysis_lutea.AAC.1
MMLHNSAHHTCYDEILAARGCAMSMWCTVYNGTHFSPVLGGMQRVIANLTIKFWRQRGRAMSVWCTSIVRCTFFSCAWWDAEGDTQRIPR